MKNEVKNNVQFLVCVVYSDNGHKTFPINKTGDHKKKNGLN